MTFDDRTPTLPVILMSHLRSDPLRDAITELSEIVKGVAIGLLRTNLGPLPNPCHVDLLWRKYPEATGSIDQESLDTFASPLIRVLANLPSPDLLSPVLDILDEVGETSGYRTGKENPTLFLFREAAMIAIGPVPRTYRDPPYLVTEGDRNQLGCHLTVLLDPGSDNNDPHRNHDLSLALTLQRKYLPMVDSAGKPISLALPARDQITTLGRQ